MALNDPVGPDSRIGPMAVLLYRNHRGEVGRRHVIPVRLYYGATEWYPEPQYLLEVWDLDKEDRRDFAVCNIILWLGGAEQEPGQ